MRNQSHDAAVPQEIYMSEKQKRQEKADLIERRLQSIESDVESRRAAEKRVAAHADKLQGFIGELAAVPSK